MLQAKSTLKLEAIGLKSHWSARISYEVTFLDPEANAGVRFKVDGNEIRLNADISHSNTDE